MNKTHKPITYNITDAQVEYIQSHTLNFLYGRNIYWLFSDRMTLYYPFLMEKKRARIPLEELLSYCHNQRIAVYPMTLRKTKFRTRLANWAELVKVNKTGLLLESIEIIRLINEYAKYCLVKYPIHIAEK
ncbi:MAG: hypothetical protein J5959_07615 [Butyrivibrio sp.]|nr:hypothetical protein [Butyrivibrio sp.]